MKRAIILAALLSVIGVAQADQTIHSADKKVSLTVHSVDLDYGVNENDNLQVDFWLSMSERSRVTRERYAMTGCEKGGGRIAQVDYDTGKIIGKQEVWLYDGQSLLDGAAAAACSEVAKQYAASKKSKPAHYNAPRTSF